MRDPVVSALAVDIARTRARASGSLAALAEVAWNYLWSWLPDGPELFRDLDPDLWERTGGNPRAILEESARAGRRAEEPALRRRILALRDRMEEALALPADPRAAAAAAALAAPVAYLSAEYGLHPSLPLYAGGLGVLAGDHLKAASDLGLPVVAVGLRYRQGYFIQEVDAEGRQREVYRDTPYGRLPVGLLLGGDGRPLTVGVPFRERFVTLQLWGVLVGRVPLVLLDSDREDNAAEDRWITGHLYGGDAEMRLAQEVVLGIGGARALRALGYAPAAYHLNEGHAAFLALELLREQLALGVPYPEARERVRGRCVFTTHTPVAAGHDVFHPEHVAAVLAAFARQCPEGAGHLPVDRLLEPARDGTRSVNMTCLALRSSRAVNGVSRLHGEVSRRMFPWAGREPGTAPIAHVTNGVHLPTWMAPEWRALLRRHLGSAWERHPDDPAAWSGVEGISDTELWEVRCTLRARLIAHANRARWRRGTGTAGALDPEALTIGFARRVATYKRLHLLLFDRERAARLLNAPGRPAQLLLSGKAHPHDGAAHDLLAHVLEAGRDPRISGRAAFLPDYGMEQASLLVAGADVWLNVPRRPLEASGTSGMKAALNGGLNCSILDGWWAEAYNGRNGWAVGASPPPGGEEPAALLTWDGDPETTDARDATDLYRLLEEEVIPLFYERGAGASGPPHRWLVMLRESLKSIGPRFNAQRMAAEYAARVYAPAGE